MFIYEPNNYRNRVEKCINLHQSKGQIKILKNIIERFEQSAALMRQNIKNHKIF